MGAEYTQPEWRLAVEERFACTHASLSMRVKTASNGVRHYWMQCLRCGTGRSATREERRQTATAEPFDNELQQSWWKAKSEAVHTAYLEQRQVEQQAWFDEHSAYLSSPAWRRRRKLVLERDRFTCQARLDGCGEMASQVHHLTYDHWQNEPLFDLISVCTECHESITGMDRARRGAA